MLVRHGNGKALLHIHICVVAGQQDEQQVDA